MRYVLGILCLLLGQEALAGRSCNQPSDFGRCWWKQGWAVTVYSGPLTSQTSSKIIRDPDFSKSGIIAFAVSKELRHFLENRLGFELESQAVQHFGKQRHFEINPIVLIARWSAFPWNRSLPTTLAIGDGVSIATTKPKHEVERRGKHDSARTLNYVMAEATFAHPCYPQWALVARYHHRSGMFGVFHGVHDASTAFAAGLKYWF